MRETEVNQIAEALSSGQSLLVLGEPGSGKTTLAGNVRSRLIKQGYTCAIGKYDGSAKDTLNDLAEQFDVDLTYTDENDRTKQKTAKRLRDDLLKELTTSKALLIVDDAHRWSASLRYWLEDCWRASALLLLVANSPKPEGIFTKVPIIELSLLGNDEIRQVMRLEADSHGLKLSIQELAELQQRAGNNPAIAKRIIRETALGLKGDKTGAAHYQFVDGTPLLIVLIMAVGVVRFVGLGLGDKSLYIMGGILTLVGLALRSILYASNRGRRSL